MKKWLLGIIGIILILSGTAIAGGPSFSGGGSGGAVATASDCDVAAYYPIGKLCQDTDNGKLYKGTGAAIEEIGTGSGSIATDTIWDAAGDTVYGTGANTSGRLAKGTAYQLYMMNSGATAPAWTSTLGATGTRLTKGWFTDLEITNAPTVNGEALTTILQPLDSDLTTIAGLTPVQNKIIIGDSSPAWSVSAFTLAAPSTAGGILYSDGTNWARLAAGSANYMLGMNSGGTAPEWKSSLSISSLDLTSATSAIPWVVSESAPGTFATNGMAWYDSNGYQLVIRDQTNTRNLLFTPSTASITASKPVCTDANGLLGVCAGTEGVWETDGAGSMTYPTGTGLAVVTSGASWGTTITPGTGVATALAANVNGSGGLLTYDAELASLAGLTFADASIIQLTGAGESAVLTSGGANRILGSNSDNTALEFKSTLAIDVLDLSTATSSIPMKVGTDTVDAGMTAAGKMYFESDTEILSIGDGATIIDLRMTAGKKYTFPTDDATLLSSGGALGTPASGTLTNCTGLPVSGITASTSTALGVGTVELGHASDTTLARVSAGVASVEGKNIVLEGAATGGVLLGDDSPDAAGELGYASNQLSVHDGTASRSLLQVASTEITKSEYLPIRYAEDDDSVTAPAATAEIGTTTQVARSFAEDADNGVVFWFHLPLDYSSGIKFRVYFATDTNASAGETAVFNLSGCAMASSGALACSEGTGQESVLQLTADEDTGELLVSGWSAAITLGGSPAAGQMAKLLLTRDVTGGSTEDDMAGHALVSAIEVKYKAKVNAVGDY